MMLIAYLLLFDFVVLFFTIKEFVFLRANFLVDRLFKLLVVHNCSHLIMMMMMMLIMKYDDDDSGDGYV